MTLQHKSGGTITALTHIGHETYKGVADWFFIGDVEWLDGSKSKATQIPAWALCGEIAETRPIIAKLNDYLAEAGEWHEPKHKRDGRIVRWTPKAKEGRVAL